MGQQREEGGWIPQGSSGKAEMGRMGIRKGENGEVVSKKGNEEDSC